MSLSSRGGDCCELGLRRRYSLRSTFSLGGMHHAAKLDRTSQISDGFQRHPQTISSPPPQRKVISGTKDSARCIGPVRWPAAAECLTNLARLCASISANGPRKNSFRPDSPLTTTSNRGRKTQTDSPTTPDMVRSGRVL